MTITDSIHPVVPAREDIIRLASLRPDAGLAVSLILPTHERGDQTAQDPIRFRNLLRTAANLLESGGVDKRMRESLLAPAHALGENPDIWMHAGSGLAVYLSPDHACAFELSYDPGESAIVAPCFALRRLVPALWDDIDYRLLVLSQRRIRLFRPADGSLEPVPLQDTPTSMDELAAFFDPEKSLQWHTGTADAGPAAQRPAAFHGQGAAEQDANTRLRELLTMVDRALLATLAGSRRAPLFLAGDERVLSAFRGLSEHPNIADPAISGNVDHLAVHELLQRVRPLIKEVASRRRRDALQRCREVIGHERSSTRLNDIVVAAAAGQVELLVAPRRIPQRRPPEGQVDEHALELAVADTLRTSGEVLVADDDEMPADTPITAVLRPGARDTIGATPGR